jgi:A/G-specific adenine glycosylase
MTIAQFRKQVWAHAAYHGRSTLPWRRKSATPYNILVSEFMLQQTQVRRVIPFYEAFLKRFPTVEHLARAPLSSILRMWQGLGYNRRAKQLHEAARVIVKEYRGKVPRKVEELEKLPGVGPYTARAVAAFAYNEDTVFIETNIRTAVTHHLFPDKEIVSDAELLLKIEEALPKGRAHDWYGALMDYGSYLKSTGVRINSRSLSYTKQKAFKGSTREARGAILKAVTLKPRQARELHALLGKERREQMKAALVTLVRDGMLQKGGTTYRLPTAGPVSSARSKAQVKVPRRR